ncbi:APC family permease [Frigoribacterium sp. CFBP9030]|uniref:APC family permease n=1 Tax=Frigoribacterium sp. CFBP9030 TaxID=3096537 RepID=UPI002A69B131|nr:amino acid permease [Frigoribacterium sp. CFBP9030]MDY0891122.1 amino acid permease [Frigoribacterium sp. CFBP9030]
MPRDTASPSARLSLAAQLRQRKPIEAFAAESDASAAAATDSAGRPRLRRSLGVWHLTAISIGATLGTGILVVLGTAVPLAGPAVWIAFVLAGVAALLSALSYAEMAGSVPVSGSSYSYAYATLGEGLAWVCGWCLVLEYAVSVAAVAVGAGQYVNEALGVFGLALPDAIAEPPGAGGVVNLPAALLVIVAMLVLVPGAREGAWVNTVLVVVKIGLLVFFVAVAFTAFSAGNFEPLAPMGAAGVSAAASRLFFSYIGFDAASTAGEEARDPKRDLPRAIIASIVIITVLYILVAVAAIGARPWETFTDGEASLVAIVAEITGQPWVAFVFAVAAVLAIASVVLTVLYGQTRIFVSMSRDGLVPRVLGRISPRTQTPVAGTLIVGGAVALAAALVPLGALADATSIGTLFAFALVNVSVIWLRRNRPELDRTFRVPLYPVVPVLGCAFCVLLMVTLGWITWLAFGVWMLVGAAVYLGYGRRHSVLARAS